MLLCPLQAQRATGLVRVTQLESPAAVRHLVICVLEPPAHIHSREQDLGYQEWGGVGWGGRWEGPGVRRAQRCSALAGVLQGECSCGHET